MTMDAFCLVVDSRKSEFWGKMSEKSTTRSEEKIFRRRESEWMDDDVNDGTILR